MIIYCLNEDRHIDVGPGWRLKKGHEVEVIALKESEVRCRAIVTRMDLNYIGHIEFDVPAELITERTYKIISENKLRGMKYVYEPEATVSPD